MDESFHDDVERYFLGDLDAVERRAFERELANPKWRLQFAAEWDARFSAHGLAALHAPDPDLSACFSYKTLRAHAADALTPVDAALVDAHLGCPLCRAQWACARRIDACTRTPTDEPEPSSLRRAIRRSTRWIRQQGWHSGSARVAIGPPD